MQPCSYSYMYHIIYSCLILYSFPEHIKKAVERYAVLTNVQPAQFTGKHKDTRLRAAKESYGLEKAVFIPRELIHARGCGTLRIFNGDISRMQAEYHQRYGKNYYEQLCDKSPGEYKGNASGNILSFTM